MWKGEGRFGERGDVHMTGRCSRKGTDMDDELNGLFLHHEKFEIYGSRTLELFK